MVVPRGFAVSRWEANGMESNGRQGQACSRSAIMRLVSVQRLRMTSTTSTARLLDGKRIAEDLLDNLKARVDVRVAACKSRPGLAVVLAGRVPASAVLVCNH